ncbi:Zinc finger RING-type [Arabidopsis suecica]|uniref:RING-type E3 ubiquitin transferase n=1 Tax=Arabidopsis suecica TaxID=45249 RepID=A0A8T1ZCS2_ARASU|nr:Zinc finger RING-type [Arabidopsis suecica]
MESPTVFESQPTPQQDIETGHLTPTHPQQDIKTGYMMQIEKIEFKGIEEEGFDEICCSVCLEEFEDGHDIIRIKICRHVFHRLCIDSWLKQNQSCPNCRCF